MQMTTTYLVLQLSFVLILRDDPIAHFYGVPCTRLPILCLQLLVPVISNQLRGSRGLGNPEMNQICRPCILLQTHVIFGEHCTPSTGIQAAIAGVLHAEDIVRDPLAAQIIMNTATMYAKALVVAAYSFCGTKCKTASFVVEDDETEQRTLAIPSVCSKRTPVFRCAFHSAKMRSIGIG